MSQRSLWAITATTINRVQDNYVVQWGDAAPADKRRAIKSAKPSLPAEFDHAIDPSIAIPAR